MTRQFFLHFATGCALIGGAYAAFGPGVSAQSALALGSARITIAGTSNVHAYTASTTTARITRVQIAPTAAGVHFWQEVVAGGALQVFEIAVPAAKLTSDQEGLDKNMHKALKVPEHPEITFRLLRLEAKDAFGPLRAVGVLKIAGIEREIALALTTERKDNGLLVKGETDLLMTDYGIAPPKAMLGILKTDPKVTITFETVLSVPLT